MTDDQTVQLPEAFSDLNGFVERWANGGMAEQYAARLASSMNELQEFYDAMKPRILDIRAYLDAIDFSDYSPSDIALATPGLRLGAGGRSSGSVQGRSSFPTPRCIGRSSRVQAVSKSVL